MVELSNRITSAEGDWHPTLETKNPRPKTHLMRVMLNANLAVEKRFANGTQGRLLHWHPAQTDGKRKALPAYSTELTARFCKESSLTKQTMMPGTYFYIYFG